MFVCFWEIQDCQFLNVSSRAFCRAKFADIKDNLQIFPLLPQCVQTPRPFSTPSLVPSGHALSLLHLCQLVNLLAARTTERGMHQPKTGYDRDARPAPFNVDAPESPEDSVRRLCRPALCVKWRPERVHRAPPLWSICRHCAALCATGFCAPSVHISQYIWRW